jgi:hypothetical protein
MALDRLQRVGQRQTPRPLAQPPPAVVAFFAYGLKMFRKSIAVTK